MPICVHCKKDKYLMKVLLSESQKDSQIEIWCLKCMKQELCEDDYVLVPTRLCDLLFDNKLAMLVFKDAIKNDKGL